MLIRDYYIHEFRNDLKEFIPVNQIPYFGHSWHNNCSGLEKITYINRANFLICLFFTVLVDQAMHAHYREYYSAFESLTRYPKFCHGLGQFNKNPRDIILSPIENGFVRKEEIDGLLNEGMSLFVNEVIDFFKTHMPEINSHDFFHKLIYDPDVQIPLIVVLCDPNLKNETEYLIYDAIKKAVDNKMNNGHNSA